MEQLSAPQLEALGDALLDFTTPQQLANWLQNHPIADQSDN
ncbi:MAG: DUF4351 domain-containing protein [Cyanobacteria bacterium J06559_3]